MNTITEALEGTLGLVSREDGWCQGTIAHRTEDGNLQRCIIGAAVESMDSMAQYDDIIDRLCDAAGVDVEQELDENGDPLTQHPLATWNDQPDTTQEDVILVVKRALYGAQEGS